MQQLAILLLLLSTPAVGFTVEQHKQFDVVIAGGSTAAFAAAISAAECGASVALLEPTDWIGGQLTSSGVPAIDEAWHMLQDEQGNRTMDVARIARTPANITPSLQHMLQATGCPGKCWVSRFCFQPNDLLQQHLVPLERRHENLTIFRETVVKRVSTADNRITSLSAIQRVPRPDVLARGYDKLPSQDLVDWYSEAPSERFTKVLHEFVAHQSTQFIDATEWGELLALSGAPYLLGVEHEDGALTGDDSYGQSITFGFVQELHATADPTRDAAVPSPKLQNLGWGDYRDRENAWDLVWTYRRLRANEQDITSGDLSLQNWGYSIEHGEGGNDYPFGYLFLDLAATRKQIENWQGGVDLTVMMQAERRAFAWHHWLKQHAPASIAAARISLSKNTLGTGHGLSKLPYIRDTRRSVGIDGFIIKVADLSPTGPSQLARIFQDRIALGAYPIDVHPMTSRKYPPYIYKTYPVAPFTIPFRALTNDRYDNLLVAGKTMAQSFLANSATRLHPTEWSTGTAAGVAAQMMSEQHKTSRELVGSMLELQNRVRAKTPIDWSVPRMATE